MPLVAPVGEDDQKTMALPIQRPEPTDRVAGRPPLSKPPTTPRPAPGPRQPGPQGPSGPPSGVPNAPGQAGPPPARAGSAPSPADQNATRPAEQVSAGPRAIAQPQRVPPAAEEPAGAAEPTGAKRSRRWLLAVGAAAVVLVLVLAGIAVALLRGDSPEDQVRAAIDNYTSALHDGDLAALRESTCGPLHEFYRNITPEQFASVHQQSRERRSIPVVDGVDAIKITDNTALAQATVYTEADPGNRSARTFDLEKTDSGWKVCDRPTEAE
ncbi:hypothetical protein [Nocardia farcinica]|nr:hypothetical protein [Nocardia farcinica]MBF6522568.1 hypothetical protein [Nocardia farcinica]